MTGSWSTPGGFFANADFDYEARIMLGAAAAGTGDVGLVLATLDGITDGDSQSWFDAWSGTAADMAARGEEAMARGHLHTASWAYLAAAEYYGKALVFVDGLADRSVLLPTFRQGRRCWEQVIDASRGRFVRVQVPCEDTTMPGYLLRPDASGAARPKLVVTNGSDGTLPGLLGYGGAEALERGWNVFLFDGPGQQSMLFERGIPFRYDWEAVLTPVIDVLVARADVDASALTGYAISQGGYWITRAIAFERRMVAAVADPGVLDVSAGWTAHLPPDLLKLLDEGQKDAFNTATAQAQATAGPESARTLARTLWSAARGRPGRWAADLAPDVTRVALTGMDRRLADQVGEEAPALCPPDVSGLVRGMLAGDPDAIEATAAGLASAGRLTVEAFAREELACAAAAAGDRDRATTALDAALAGYQCMGAVPDRDRALGRLRALGVRRGSREAHRDASFGWASLTATENRIAALVREGLTNREIGTRLFVSPQTVQTHVSHILQKTGLRSRVEIPRAAPA